MGRSVILVGPRCSGKTLTGKELARISGVPFVDADEVFVELYHKSLSDFVAEYGWGRFRDGETKTIEKICSRDQGTRIVLTPGGGAVAHDQGEEYRQRNVELLRAFGTIIYLLPTPDLEESARILHARMQADQQTAGQRPPLTEEKDPFREMLDKVKQRHHYYLKAADEVLYTEGKTVQEVARDIAELVR